MSTDKPVQPAEPVKPFSKAKSAVVRDASQAIREYGPICCRLPSGEMERWTRLALADDLDPCIAELKRLEKSHVEDAE